MHYTFDLNFNFSIFGLLIFGILVWGGYRGYLKGGIVMGLSLFALLAGVIVSAGLTRATYTYFWHQNSKVPDVFGSVVLGLSFIFGIWFSNYVLKAVNKRVKDTNPDKTNNFIGAALGITKFFIIVGIYSTVILNLDYNGNFLPERDKKSYLMNTSAFVMTKTVKLLQMDFHRTTTGPTNSPINKKKSRINFPKTKNNSNNNTNNTNQNKTNNSNNSNNLVSDVDDNNP